MIDNPILKWRIYPIKSKNMHSLLKQDNPIYIKYPVRTPSKKYKPEMSENDLVFFYIAKKKIITHYAKIQSVSIYYPEQILKDVINNTQMTIDEFQNYSKNRRDCPLIAFKLDKISNMNKVFYPMYHVSMTGRFFKHDEIYVIESLINQDVYGD